MKRGKLLALVLLWSSPDAFAQRYFPLDEGNTWTYEGDQFSGRPINSVVDVDDVGLATFSRGRPDILRRLAEEGSEIYIEVEAEGFVLLYAFDESEWIHRNVGECEDSRKITVGTRDEVVHTPAGVFEDCIRLDYGPGICADAGIFAEWFAPNVGLVKWVENNFVGPVTYSLASFTNTHPDPAPYTRGDVNEDGREDLSDAVGILLFLFRNAELNCERSADTNDDQKVGLSDAVALLEYLFRAGATPKEPFAECGFDPDPSELPCPSSAPCE